LIELLHGAPEQTDTDSDHSGDAGDKETVFDSNRSFLRPKQVFEKTPQILHNWHRLNGSDSITLWMYIRLCQTILKFLKKIRLALVKGGVREPSPVEELFPKTA
jgi:hypothetical protein